MSRFNLSAFAVRERAITLFLIVAIILAGGYAFLKLGRAEDPAFTVKVMTVSAVWPGATAKEMQDQVGDRLEKRLQELEFYDRAETAAYPGMLTMKLYLKDSTPPKAVADEFYQARKKLGDERVNLPSGVIGPIVNDEYSDVYFTMYALAAKGLPQRQLVLEAETLRQRLSRIEGVEKVTLLGEQAPKIFVEISYKRLATLGVKATDLFHALETQNDLTPSGFVDTAGPRVYLRLDSGINGVEAVKSIPVESGGKLLKIGDVAEVSRGNENPASKQIRHQGEPSLILALVMKKGFNGLRLGALLKEEETAIRKELPVGLELSKVSDQSHMISESINEFMIKFMVALAVVIVVSLATMGFRVGIVVAAAVPLTLAAVFVIMLLTGKDFDRITLGALIISLGLLVDDAIIAIEMMVVKMEQDWHRIEAATFAWVSTAGPMLSGTLVTIIGFLPVGFAKSTAGEYAGNIFWVVAFSLITSWFVAVLFTPYLGVKLLPDIKPLPGGHNALYATPNYQRFRRMVRRVVDHKWLAAGVTIILFTLSVTGMGVVEKQFFPNSDRPELTVEVNLPPGTAFAATERSVKKIEKTIMAEAEAQAVTSYIGQGVPRFILPLDSELPNPAYAQIVVKTTGPAARDALKLKLRDLIAQGAFPEARVRVKQFIFGPPVPFPVLFRVMGPDENELRRIASETKAIMAENPNLRDAHLDWGERTPSQHLVLDQERLRLLGLTPQATGQQLQAILNGAPTTQMRDGIRSVDVVVRAPGSEHHSLDNLASVALTTKDGRSIPLSQIVHFASSMEDAVLKRYNREPYISVQGDVIDGVQPPDVTAQILPKLEKLKAALPAGYRLETGGAVEESARANTALVKLFPLMVLLMLTVIMIQVRSFSAMFMVFASAPLGLVGAVPTLLLFHQPFGFNAILGLIGLAGIIMRNTLILVDQIRQDQIAGLNDYDAIVESTVRRARPVVLTAVAAMLAFIPLTFSSFWGSMAYVLIGGVGVGTVLTLLFLPALYAIWFKVKQPKVVTEEGALT